MDGPHTCNVYNECWTTFSLNSLPIVLVTCTLVRLVSQHQQTMILYQGHMFLAIRESFILVAIFHPHHCFSMLAILIPLQKRNVCQRMNFIKRLWIPPYEITPIVEINRAWKGTNRHKARIWKNFSRLRTTKWKALLTVRHFHSQFQAITLA